MDRQEWAKKFYETYVSEPMDNPGENSVKCPWHDDNVSSMSINLKNGRFYCHVCDIGGDEYEFFRIEEGYEKYQFGEMVKEIEKSFGKRPEDVAQANEDVAMEDNIIPEREIQRFVRILKNTDKIQQFLSNKRGLREQTLQDFEIGYDLERITIPIRNSSGDCVNIRKYSPEAKGTAKMVSYKQGYGKARLFPVSNLKYDDIMLVEGEMDCLLANQLGYHAITATGGANTWKTEWNGLFQGKNVVVCYDIDDIGRISAEKVARELCGIANTIRVVKLPIVDPPNGDLTDYIVSLGHSKEDFDAVIADAKTYTPKDNKKEEEEPTHVSLAEASDAIYLNKRIVMDVVVSGKDTAPYTFPRKVCITCSPEHKRCQACKVAYDGGFLELEFEPTDREILNLIDCTDSQQQAVLKKFASIPKNCGTFSLEIIEQMNIEEVILQPELDFSEQDRPYTTRVAYVVGNNIQANTSYRMVGRTVADPKKQYVTHVIEDAQPSQDNIATFNLDADKLEALKAFQQGDLTVKDKMLEIARDFTHNVTHIYAREDLIQGIDLVYHSVLSFFFQEQLITRGWVEGIAIGDTRTGKSETASALMNHYRLGEFITGENSTFAGLIGGMQQTQKRWFVSWGKIPLNDRRLVIIDEVSGLTEDEIGDMSGVRSSGVAEITKIHQERTHARTRLFWISNTRTGEALKNFDYGIRAIKELIGRNEDIARFEFAITCASEEVSFDIINSRNHETVEHKYTGELCKQLILWAWSRKAEDVIFTPEATDLILAKANEMAKHYISDIPLVEGANQRIKLARLSVATACRLFSTDSSGEKVVVKPEHVEYVCEFLNSIYKKPSMGYWDLSQQVRLEERAALENIEKVSNFLQNNPFLALVFMKNSIVNSRDLEDMLDLDSSTVRSYLKFLIKNGMLEKKQQGYVKKPTFINILRRGNWDDTK